VKGGTDHVCGHAKNAFNFVWFDEMGNEQEIDADTQDDETTSKISEHPPLSRSELIAELDTMLERYKDTPASFMMQPISHYDLCSTLMLVSAIFKTS
jgi:hypothetical protein